MAEGSWVGLDVHARSERSRPTRSVNPRPRPRGPLSSSMPDHHTGTAAEIPRRAGRPQMSIPLLSVFAKFANESARSSQRVKAAEGRLHSLADTVPSVSDSASGSTCPRSPAPLPYSRYALP
jgi:hypothetical protein